MTTDPARPRFVTDTLLPIAAACSLALFANAFTPINTDLGWMLRFGRELFERGALMATNVVSFTEPSHAIVMPEWGACALFYLAHHAAGAAGLIATKWALLTLTVIGVGALIWSHCQSALVRLLILFAATHVMWIGFDLVRSQLFSFVLLGFVLRAALSDSRVALWLCVPVVALWVNLHGGFPVGLLVLGGVCAARVAEQRLGLAKTGLGPRHLLIVPVAAGLATLLNPYGWRLIALVLHHSSDPARFLVREWIPLWELPTLSFWETFSFGLLLAVGALCAILLPRRQLRLWFLLVVAVALGVSANRHLRLAPILLAPVVATAIGGLKLWSSERWRKLERLAPIASGAALAGFGLMFAFGAPAALRFIDHPVPTPANVVAVMRLNHLSGNVWNDYDWGGMLQWALPESRVACDGRHTLAYSPELITTNIRFGYTGEDPLEVLTRYHADFAVLPPTNPATKLLAQKWTMLFCDRSACLLSGRPEHAGAFIETLKMPATESSTSDYFQSPELPALTN